MELKEVVKQKYGEAARRVTNRSFKLLRGSALLDQSVAPITSGLYDEQQAAKFSGGNACFAGDVEIQLHSQH